MTDASGARCRRSREQATLFVAGELGLLARARFTAHRRHCAECAAAVSEMEEAGAALAVLEQPRLSAAARERLSAAARHLRSRAPRPGWRPVLSWRLAAVATALAATLAVALVYRPGPPRLESEVAVDPMLLAWDPAPDDLARIADEIRILRRSPTSTADLSRHDRTLSEIRQRIDRLRDPGSVSPSPANEGDA